MSYAMELAKGVAKALHACALGGLLAAVSAHSTTHPAHAAPHMQAS